MFGYVFPDKPELKIKEYETYRAFYCGVCKAIGKGYGIIPRFTLNYDIAFLAVLLSSVSGKSSVVSKEGCLAHPIRKRHVILSDESIDYAADMNIALSYLNLADKWKDEKPAWSLAAIQALKKSYKRVAKKYPQKIQFFLARLKELNELESHCIYYHGDLLKLSKIKLHEPDQANNERRCEAIHSLDEAAEPFAKLMEELVIFMPAIKDSNTEQILRWIGYNMGKWIYTMDAVDDFEKDIERKAYNPLVFSFNYNSEQENADEFFQRIRDKLDFNLTHTLSELSKGFELLDIRINRGILENIIYLGMLKKTEKVLGKSISL